MKRLKREGPTAKIPPGAKMVARPTRWGNPFPVKFFGQEGSLWLFEFVHLANDPDLIKKARKELTGFDLVCYCPLDKPCHGDIWLKILAKK